MRGGRDTHPAPTSTRCQGPGGSGLIIGVKGGYFFAAKASGGGGRRRRGPLRRAIDAPSRPAPPCPARRQVKGANPQAIMANTIAAQDALGVGFYWVCGADA